MTKEKLLPLAKTKHHKASISKGIRFFLGVAIILGIGYLVLNYVPFIAKYDYYVIATDSMEPVIMPRDVVLIDTSVSLDDLTADGNTIIAFYTDFNGDGVDEVVVHYLDEITTDGNGTRIYRTKPAVSDSQDSWILYDEDIIGTHVLTIPKIGSFILFAQSTIGKAVLVSDIIVICLLMDMFSDKKKKTEKEDMTES